MLEERVFVRFHDVPRGVDHLLWLPMQAGSAWAPVVAAVIGWYVTRSWRPTIGALVVGWGGWVLAKGVKVLVGRGRPWEELGSDLVRASAPSEGLGFVSGHTTVAFACAAVLAPYLSRKWRAVGYALATVVALGRIVVGAHFPLDVIGGASLGTAVGLPVAPFGRHPPGRRGLMTSSGREVDPYAGSWARRRLDLVVLVVAAVTVGVSAVVGCPRHLLSRGNRLPRDQRPARDPADHLCGSVQFFGGLLVPAAAAIGAALFRKWRLTLALLLLIPLKLLIEKGVIKELIFRARPATSVCEGDLNCLNLRDVPAVGPSFPSGHVIIAFGIGWLIAPYLGRRGQWAVLALCLLVAFSRIYLGAHNPLDVVAGAASGIALAAALNLMLGVPRRAEA